MCTRFILHSLVSCSSKSGSALLYFRPSDLHLDRAVARSAGNFYRYDISRYHAGRPILLRCVMRMDMVTGTLLCLLSCGWAAVLASVGIKN
jgi:hypothetical protein